jgi:hypothetical protein
MTGLTDFSNDDSTICLVQDLRSGSVFSTVLRFFVLRFSLARINKHITSEGRSVAARYFVYPTITEPTFTVEISRSSNNYFRRYLIGQPKRTVVRLAKNVLSAIAGVPCEAGGVLIILTEDEQRAA